MNIKNPPSFFIEPQSAGFNLDLKPNLPIEVDLLRIFLNFGYYWCIVPYKIIWVDRIGRFSVIQNNIQKGVCFLGYLALLACFVVFSIWKWKSDKKSHTAASDQRNSDADTPKIVFYFFQIVGNFTVVYFVWLIWRNSSTFSWLFNKNLCQHSEDILQSNSNVDSDNLMIVKNTWLHHHHHPDKSDAANEMFGIFPLDNKQRLENSERKISQARTKSIIASSVMIFVLILFEIANAVALVQNKMGQLGMTLSPESTVNIVFVIFFVIRIVSLIHYFDLFLIILILIVKQRIDLFVDMVLKNVYPADKVLQGFYNMKEYIDKINDTFSYWVLSFFVSTLPFYSLEIRRLIKVEGQNLMKYLTFIYVLYFVACLVLSASASAKVHNLKNWLAINNNVMKIPSQKLLLFLNELQVESIGLKGGKYFTVNYKFIGSITSLIVTYTIIILQWNN